MGDLELRRQLGLGGGDFLPVPFINGMLIRNGDARGGGSDAGEDDDQFKKSVFGFMGPDDDGGSVGQIDEVSFFAMNPHHFYLGDASRIGEGFVQKDRVSGKAGI